MSAVDSRHLKGSRTILAVDAQGGDHGPSVIAPAAHAATRRQPDLDIVLVGDEASIQQYLPTDSKGIRVLHAPEVIAADAGPRDVLRRGKDSSLWRAMELVAAGEAQACVSAGNTVALMTLGVKLLGRLPGIKRPALMSHIPSGNGVTGLLDLGANLNVDALQLFQFALMGSVVRSGEGIENPSIGLLNVGHEDSKGHATVREAHERLLDSGLNYEGFIEGHDIFEGKVDVAVCDGFAGNLILKSSEGLAGMLFAEIRKALGSGVRAKAGAWLARPALRAMLARLDPAKHNGAPLLGLSGVLVKSHGRSQEAATTEAILEAGREVKKNVPERIAEIIRRYHAEEEI